MHTPILFIRPWIWLRRFRHRRGYGVHSPYAFDYIMHVIYEDDAYYKYKSLVAEQRRLRPAKGRQWAHAESTKLKRLLFRIVNHAQPTNIIDLGPVTASELYLRAGKDGVDYLHASNLSELFLDMGMSVDFLYVHDFRNPQLVHEALNVCLQRTAAHSVFVIEGIGYTAGMRRIWNDVKCHEGVGITFDLFDVGIVFFDFSMHKQDYVVNFMNYFP